MRDITLEDTVYFNFTTRAFATGIPTVLAGTPVLSVLESNNATPITSGVSVSVDRASVVGLNQATVVATAANGYEAGKSYAVYISTGTVGGVSVIGEVVAEFTVQASAAFTRLGAPVGASISADIAGVQADTDNIQTRIPAALGANGNIKADVRDFNGTAGTFASGRPEVNTTHWEGVAVNFNFTANAPDVNVTHIAASAVSGSGNITFPTGIIASTTNGVGVIRYNQAQAGAATTITLDALASSVTDFYKNDLIVLTSGTGAGQARYCTAYNGTTNVATVQSAWVTNPDSTTFFDVIAADLSVGALTAAGVRTAVGLASANLDTQLDALPTATENADAMLNRDMSAVSDTNARSPLNALRFLRNKWSLSGSTLTVTEEDDVTTAWTAAVTTDAAADPITGSNPA